MLSINADLKTPRAGTDMTAQIEAVDFFAFDNSYARLPDRFFALLPPTPVVAPRLVRLNEKLAWHLRLDPRKLAAPEGVEILAGNRVKPIRAASISIGVPAGFEPLAGSPMRIVVEIQKS